MSEQENDELIAKLQSIGLHGTSPSVGELMYQCGFAAGQKQASRNAGAPGIRMLASAAALLLVGFIVGRWNHNDVQPVPIQVSKEMPKQEPLWLWMDKPSRDIKVSQQIIAQSMLQEDPIHLHIDDVASNHAWPADTQPIKLTPRGPWISKELFLKN